MKERAMGYWKWNCEQLNIGVIWNIIDDLSNSNDASTTNDFENPHHKAHQPCGGAREGANGITAPDLNIWNSTETL